MKLAVVTLLYDPSYTPGALVLGARLRELIHNSLFAVELAVLIDKPKFSAHQLEILLKVYDTLIPLTPLTSTLSSQLENDLGRPELAATFSKVALWGLSQYSKVLYLDADTLPSSPRNGSGSVLDLLRLNFPNNKILAAPDSGFPDIFNSGVFVLRPNPVDYESLLHLVYDSQRTGAQVSFDGADQGLLNQYFNALPDWVARLLADGLADATNSPAGGSNWIKIPFLYNVTPSAQYEYLPAYKHFAPGGQKGPEQLTDSIGNITEDSPMITTQETVSRYALAARSYFKGGDQIKLMHFIGPSKPWVTVDKHEVHLEWWSVWYEFFGGNLTINKVVFAKGQHLLPRTPIVDYLEENPDLESNCTEEVTQETLSSVPSSTDPLLLCDPRTYQDTLTIEPTADSAWDPTTEEPPKDASPPQVHDFEERVGIFENAWDQPDSLHEPSPPPVQSVVQHFPPPALFPQHEALAPERIFYEEEEVAPTRGFEELSVDNVDEEISDDEAEMELDLEEDQELDNLEIPEPVHNYEPIFPWEFREVTPPERTFEATT